MFYSTHYDKHTGDWYVVSIRGRIVAVYCKRALAMNDCQNRNAAGELRRRFVAELTRPTLTLAA